MTRPAAVKKLLDRKEAKLTALLEIDAEISSAEKQLLALIEAQRCAFEAAVAAGWSPAELAELGMARRRRLYHLANKHSDHARCSPNGDKIPAGGDSAPPTINTPAVTA